jgi:hypothetical protein
LYIQRKCNGRRKRPTSVAILLHVCTGSFGPAMADISAKTLASGFGTVIGPDGCVYRKPKPGRNGDGGCLGSRVIASEDLIR